MNDVVLLLQCLLLYFVPDVIYCPVSAASIVLPFVGSGGGHQNKNTNIEGLSGRGFELSRRCGGPSRTNSDSNRIKCY